MGNLLTLSAKEQAVHQERLDALKAEVDKRDADINQLQQSLKEAETILVPEILIFCRCDLDMVTLNVCIHI